MISLAFIITFLHIYDQIYAQQLSLNEAINVTENRTLLTATNVSSLTSDNNNDIVLSTNFLTYYSPLSGIFIQYPNNWRLSPVGIEDYNQIVVLFSPLDNLTDTLPARFTISQYNYVQDITLDSYTDMVFNEFRNLGINITESKSTKLSGLDAFQISTTFGGIGNEYLPLSKVMELWTVQGNID